MNVLVTGGAGYIGSHTAVELLAVGHEVMLLDDFSNSSPAAVDAIRALANRPVGFVEADVGDEEAIDRVFAEGAFDAVVHFAAHKAVGESVAEPLRYYRNNVAGTACLVQCMAEHGVKTIVFSSSATVYGEPVQVPITEDHPTQPANPYGRTKRMVEQLLTDFAAADPSWRISILRYFNPIGAHPSGVIGEDPGDAPNNLLPYIGQVAVGRRERLLVFGDDYPTPDGTGIRDYLHVVDLARGHARALDYLAAAPGLAIHNLGTGRGYSVFEVLRAFEAASGLSIPHEVVARRPGDIAVSYADPSRAHAELGWHARYGLGRMCEDTWRWLKANPGGYGVLDGS